MKRFLPKKYNQQNGFTPHHFFYSHLLRSVHHAKALYATYVRPHTARAREHDLDRNGSVIQQLKRPVTLNVYQKSGAGFTLLISVLVAGIVLSIGLAILNITIKEFLLSGVARESQVAFSAADAGMECALYWDGFGRDVFNVAATPATIECGGGNVEEYGGGISALVGGQAYGDANEFQISWGSPEVCARVEVTKHTSATLGACPAGVVCTIVISRGYNTCDLNHPRAVERALRARY